MERVNLFFLHGFLGRPNDWDAVKGPLSQSQNLRIFTPDYFNDRALGPQHSFQDWADNFTDWVENLGCSAEINILVGYSLGGRLALHAFERQPALWKKVICVSANPGFNDVYDSFNAASEERRLREKNDSYWAEEFRKAPWESVLRAWNAQPVFGGGENEPVRSEMDYSREVLGLALTQWSLAQQKNMRFLLKEHAQKVLWIVGAKDEKYVQMSNKLKNEISELQVESLPEASHRILFDNPYGLSKSICEFIFKLE